MIASSDIENITHIFAKQDTIMRRSTVLSLILQLVCPVLTYNRKDVGKQLGMDKLKLEERNLGRVFNSRRYYI
jgi:hypothetical protein